MLGVGQVREAMRVPVRNRSMIWRPRDGTIKLVRRANTIHSQLNGHTAKARAA